MTSLLDRHVLGRLHPEEFAQALPFPSHEFRGLLSAEGFAALRRDFPATEHFERHQGFERVHDQRPHDRLYLAYEQSLYRKRRSRSTRGVIGKADLPAIWQRFLDELAAPGYLDFIQELFGADEMTVRYAWHIGENRSEVSPHVDGPDKLGTHLFYFNSDEDWDESWGGATVLLGEKQVARQNPEFDEFRLVESTSCVDNRSLLFRNGEEAWHGVQPLSCPPGAQRRLFNVIFERPRARKTRPSWSPLRVFTKRRRRAA